MAGPTRGRVAHSKSDGSHLAMGAHILERGIHAHWIQNVRPNIHAIIGHDWRHVCQTNRPRIRSLGKWSACDALGTVIVAIG